MLINYLKTAIRHFSRQKLYTLLNISGLALGVAFLLLALMYWLNERSYDRFHERADNLYRITTSLMQYEGAPHSRTGGTGQVQGPAFKEAIPEVLDYVRLLGGDVYGDVRHEQEVLKMQMVFADENFFDLFTFPLLHGNPATALDEINSVVLTERAARRFFNTADAVGKLLHMEADPSAKRLGNKPMLVTGVVKDPPPNSSIQFDMLLPFRFLQLSFDDTNWLNAYLGTYVLLDKNADLTAVVEKFDQIYEQHGPPQIEEQGFDPQISYGLQPIADIHLNMLLGGSSWHEGGTVGESRPLYSNLFFGIAFFIFLLAGINFININIAGSLKRAKEVSIRKISGGSRWGLIGQFLGEAALLSGVSLLLALLLTIALLPAFNTLADKQIAFGAYFDGKFAIGLLLVFVITTILSGLYPAIVLSAFQPGEVLYNRNRSSRQFQLGKALVVLQFSLAFLLAVATVVFYAQMEFISRKALGYTPDYVIRTNISGARKAEPIRQLLRNEVARYDGFGGISFGGDFRKQGLETTVNDRKIRSVYKSIDGNYLSVLDIPLRRGENLRSESSREILVNEAFVRAAGLKDPIGQAVYLHPDYADGDEPYQVVGVMADYHFESLHQPIQPLAAYWRPYRNFGIWLKVRRDRIQPALQAFEELYHKTMPDASYEYQFLSDLNAREYDQERRWQQIIGIAAVLAMFICGLGLFGIAHLNTAQRTKEIGIRKILGASIPGLVGLLSRDFLKLVIIALMLASPVAYLLLKKWLQTYAYRIDMHWSVFALAGMAAMGVAVLTVSGQCIRAALADPVESLSKE
ncbi:MAG: ABC transporter permease [Saprospiraceae bacterium]|nr:ABC transporter permease [Lewinella sp.]